MKRFLTKLFSKTTLTIIFLLLQICVLVAIYVFIDTLPFVDLLLTFLSIVVAFLVVNSLSDGSYKVAWLFFILITPIFASLCYLLFANRKFSKRKRKQLQPTLDAIKDANKQFESKKPLLDIEKDYQAAPISKYIKKYSRIPVFDNTKTTYYAWGEDGYKVMLEKLKTAKHYIFMEYFIIEKGKMWDPIEEILIEKAKEGVDVRLMYDDLGCLNTLPRNYHKKLQKLGIKAFPFKPIVPLMDIRMNNRDHRKITVIDGHTGFTGGINLADEYINETVRFGVWKDNVLLIEGDGVFGLTSLFLSNWVTASDENRIDDFSRFLPDVYSHEVSKVKGDGFVQPYGSVPFTYETVGANVYVDLLMRARKYVYIATPYLILDQEMEAAITQAAKNGCKVKLLMPHIPDKKAVFQMSRSYYKNLMKAGVEIYEYTPGFVHSKMFIVDDIIATVGTINLDYRSLFLHFENGVLLYKNECLKDIKDDFEKTFNVSMRIQEEDIKAGLFLRIYRGVLKVIAPLL